ncbi:MAG: DUF1549 domain-containing protein [Verrucomicrobiota bacterium]
MKFVAHSPAPWPLFAALALSSLALAAAEPKPQAVPADHARQMARGMELFKGGVAELLKQNCVECHGSGKIKGDFDLATREGLLKGGAEGVSVVAGNSKGSRLLKMLRHEEEPHMPSKKPKLSDEAVAQIAAWIDAGAPYSQPLVANAKVVKDRSQVTDQDRQFWSFQPLKRLEPPAVKNKRWAQTPIDRFILARLEEKNIKPNNAVDRRALIRRAYFDLIGLPPTPEQIEAFINDKSPKAYEKLIDELLASPHYGERWGRHWLDLARFGESHGYEQDYDRPYAYHYRDFVIRALNDDLPYDKFVQWQIAGDELEPDNPQAWLATGFLAAGTHATQITANQAEKERYDELDDKVSTIGTAMLGLTIGCARCHDHKFDPIPTADYYRMISTFTTTVRSDYDIDMNPAQTRQLQAEYERAHAPLVAALQKFEKDQVPSRFEKWLETSPALPQPDWLSLEAQSLKISGAYYDLTKNERLADGSYLVTVLAGAPDTYTFVAHTALTNITAIRLEVMTHKSLPGGGPGWAENSDFALSEFTLQAAPKGDESKAQKVKLVNPRATHSAKAAPIEGALDAGKGAWRLLTQAGQNHAAIFDAEKPFGHAEGTILTVTMKFNGGNRDRHSLGRFRLSLATAQPVPALTADAFPQKTYLDARAALPIDKAKRTAAQTAALSQLFRTTDTDWQQLHRAVRDHEKTEPRPKMAKALIASEGLPAVRLHTQGPDFYEKTYYLRRGDLAQKLDPAPAGFMQILMRTPEKESHWLTPPPSGARSPHRRAALADWITDVDYGAGHLLARVIVNRLWQHHFGRGLVSTPSDFGNTGDKPTHPELLDWLASELIKSGWRLKSLHKLMMTSATYMQGDQSNEKGMSADPDNLLWWHRSPQRLEAEVIRDSILAVSGRLDRTMFGPGSLDEGHNRRSIYFTIKRSKLIPMMVQFDAPDSLQSLGRRVNTTVAPQALLLLNNPHIRASAMDFAKKLESQTTDATDQVQRAFRIALGREAAKSEVKDCLQFIDAQILSYQQDQRENPRQLALADFCQAVIGLNEFIYVE